MLPTSADGASTPMMELMRLAEAYPDLTILQVYDLIDRDRWHIDTLTPSQRTLYGKITARAALDRMRRSVADFQVAHALNDPVYTPQWLETGRHLAVDAVLGPVLLHQLTAHCDATLNVPGTPPIGLFDDARGVDPGVVQGIAAVVLAALPATLPAGSRPAILKRRSILRRTFPTRGLPAQHGNANNQFWHQDSNARFNNAPMLTLWIPLQDHAGVVRPGLQFIDAPVAHFSLVHGDSSPEVANVLAQMFPASRIVSPYAPAGTCLAFNGLTFHQTWTTPLMTAHRDAMLVRIIEARSAHLFSVSDPAQELLYLG